MKYTRLQIIKMKREGKITPAQAKHMMAEQTQEQPQPEPQPEEENPLDLLREELQKLTAAIEDTKGAEQVAEQIGKVIPVLVATYETLRQAPKPNEPPQPIKAWSVEFSRDRRGLIESPLTLRAGNEEK